MRNKRKRDEDESEEVVGMMPMHEGGLVHAGRMLNGRRAKTSAPVSLDLVAARK